MAKRKKKSKAAIPIAPMKAIPFWKKPSFISLAVILIVTGLIFFKVSGYDFVYWDDDKNIFQNQAVNTFRWSNFFENSTQIFTSTIIGNYNPLTIWTFGLENAMYGINNPGNFHLVNLILHLTCCILVYRIAFLLKLNIWGASILTILFAIHPMRVESVAWVTERKDVLYGGFFLAAMYQYLKYNLDQKKSRLMIMTLLFILALLSKIQAVTLPVVLILLDYYSGKQINISAFLKKWPYFLLSLAVGALGIYFLRQQGSLETGDIFNLGQRVFIGSYSLVIYLVKSIFPYMLSPVYPYPAELAAYFYPSIIIFPTYAYAMYWAYKKDKKAIFFGLAFFIVNIIFLLQIIGAGQGFLADRFTYIAYFGLFFIFAYYLQELLATQKYKSLVYGVLGLTTIVFSSITYNQISIWENSETLWSKALSYYTDSTLPYGNRANFYRDRGRTSEALKDYNKTLSLKANQPAALNSRAKLYFTIAKNNDTLLLALRDYNKALELDPRNGEYLINRGATYARLGNINQALHDITTGLELKPDHLAGYSNRFVLNAQSGNWEEALKDINRYLAYNPNNSDFIYERANANMNLGNYGTEVLQDLNSAINLQPNKGIYHYRKSEYHLYLNQINEAKNSYQNAITLNYTNIRQEVARRLGN